MTSRLVVLASGSGSNLQAILDACADETLDAEVVLVVVNRRSAYAAERAEAAGVPAVFRPMGPFRDDFPDDHRRAREAYDAALAAEIADARPDLVVQAGWMHLFTSAFLDRFPEMVVNLHPALPATFPGAHAIDDAWAAHEAEGLDHTGVMVHLVPDEGVDDGPVLASRRVDIGTDDTRDSLEARIHTVEHELLVSAIGDYLGGSMTETSRSGRALWIAGARPRTLPAAVVPVAVGAAAAVGHEPGAVWWRGVVALIVSLALQVGVNYANDYSDGVRGTDDERRVGPLRLVGSGLVEPAAVKRAATMAFAVAGVAGAIVAFVVGPELFVVGAACLVAGWTYTGGPRPYGYLGLGEVFVFVFFGLVATVGTTYVLVEEVTGLSILASVAVGLWATALLVVNNLRDIPGDTAVGKNTLAVRIGAPATRVVFVLMHVTALGVAIIASVVFERWAGLMVVFGLAFLIQACVDVAKGAAGPALIKVLGLTGQVQLISGLAFAAGLAISA